MTKSEIVNEIAVRTGLEKAAIADTIDNFFVVVKNSMIQGNNIYLRGFGTFELKERKTKVARNIKRNTSLVVPAHYVARFKPAKEFAQQVKESDTLNERIS
ncbi:MAG: HU family DNA-binding protein [Bacteroidia bacterium]|jgi:DNA-binding protein HU-beta|nr:integration host factor subunit beta [Bacteroidia bacterium]